MSRVLSVLACCCLLAACGSKDDSAAATGTGSGDGGPGTGAATGSGTGATGSGSGGVTGTGTGATGTGTGTTGVTGAGFRVIVVDRDTIGPSHATVTDVDGDGQFDIVVSGHGPITSQSVPPGIVRMFSWEGPTLADWGETDIIPESAGVLYPNHPTMHDVDRDGDLDAIVPTGGTLCVPMDQLGTCGGFVWAENQGGTWVKHDVVVGEEEYFESVVLTDLDGDGIEDLITAAQLLRPLPQGFTAELRWYKGLGNATGFESTPHVIGFGAGSWQTLFDIDDDGDIDIATGNAHDHEFGWWENVYPPSPPNPNGVWAYHTINGNNGDGFEIEFVEDLYGDGRLRAIGSNHTNTVRQKPPPDLADSAVFAFDMSGNLRDPWPATKLSTGMRAIQDLPIFPMDAPGEIEAADIDRDGDLDIVVAGDGDPTLYLLDQTAPGTFATRLLRTNVVRTAGINVQDLNGDGGDEIVVVGLVQNFVYIIEKL